ncbi:hypothetical protein Ciccas_006039 [Cichlidogyrus casuarinus]|uniref:Uncharacterized protein n=1 Tax=Cichlidogyrus casuarinus TaxID=1844966 RepID=A0ABD2Q792_9PLAT
MPYNPGAWHSMDEDFANYSNRPSAYYEPSEFYLACANIASYRKFHHYSISYLVIQNFTNPCNRRL